ncbi:hypothetical protein [Vibrio phage vB_VmeM-Yong XC32]|nr:hypothetical protein [Vibrio phage vB_VmeM-Yong XC31]QAX96492.1 hypothetical protein [Vibrio phage vB_VmeM-Yong XC32]QAX96809.1 hypothetical protein [Vibrio phage vB_VmeM-Yong MS31]QAX97128.1 hypothetical protein [Vibrio phage vB_VmeM-Yong MS32]
MTNDLIPLTVYTESKHVPALKAVFSRYDGFSVKVTFDDRDKEVPSGQARIERDYGNYKATIEPDTIHNIRDRVAKNIKDVLLEIERDYIRNAPPLQAAIPAEPAVEKEESKKPDIEIPGLEEAIAEYKPVEPPGHFVVQESPVGPQYYVKNDRGGYDQVDEKAFHERKEAWEQAEREKMKGNDDEPAKVVSNSALETLASIGICSMQTATELVEFVTGTLGWELKEETVGSNDTFDCGVMAKKLNDAVNREETNLFEIAFLTGQLNLLVDLHGEASRFDSIHVYNKKRDNV